jgi:hypothetical protein
MGSRRESGHCSQKKWLGVLGGLLVRAGNSQSQYLNPEISCRGWGMSVDSWKALSARCKEILLVTSKGQLMGCPNWKTDFRFGKRFCWGQALNRHKMQPGLLGCRKEAESLVILHQPPKSGESPGSLCLTAALPPWQLLSLHCTLGTDSPRSITQLPQRIQRRQASPRLSFLLPHLNSGCEAHNTLTELKPTMSTLEWLAARGSRARLPAPSSAWCGGRSYAD